MEELLRAMLLEQDAMAREALLNEYENQAPHIEAHHQDTARTLVGGLRQQAYLRSLQADDLVYGTNMADAYRQHLQGSADAKARGFRKAFG